MSNLFSSFDPTVRIFYIHLSLNWIAAFTMGIMIPQSFWIMGSQGLKRGLIIIEYLASELEAVFGVIVIPGTIFIYLGFFFYSQIL